MNFAQQPIETARMIDPRQPDFSSTPLSPSRAKFRYAPGGAGDTPSVSVITPFYNTSPVFHETARAVLGQSLQNIEWIIINDASTSEESLAMLAEYRQSDRRIRVIDLPSNAGPGSARNAGSRDRR